MDNGNGNGHVGNGNGSTPTPVKIGSDLGYAGVEQMDDQVGRYCSTERQRLEAANRPKIVSAKQDLAGVERELEKVALEESKLPPEGDLRNHRGAALFLFTFALGLCIAGFASAVYALEPFMPGVTKYFVALGMAAILPFGVHEVINRWSHSERFMRWLVGCECALAFIAMISLAFVRSQVSAEQMSQANAAVVIDGDAPAAALAPSTFYQRTICFMTIFSMFSAVGMEIAAGLAFHRACRLWAEMPANAAEIRQKRAELEQRKIELVHRIGAWEQEPEEFVNGFWRDYHEAKLRGNTASRVTKIFAAALFFLLVSASTQRAYAAEPLNLVVAVDLTASVAGASGLDQKTELQRDVASVGQLLATIPAGSRVTVIGITDRSFARPYVLLSARLDGNEGYFKERIASARQQLVAAWQKRSQGFVENFSQTDLLGALVMASQVFETKDGHRNVLIILSDMRHETRSLNLARFTIVPVKPTLDRVARASMIADLKGIEVYVLGVDAAGKSVGYWNSLRDFWSLYFKTAGADLKSYSMLRELPELAASSR
jgi:hypothetical protein